MTSTPKRLVTVCVLASLVALACVDSIPADASAGSFTSAIQAAADARGVPLALIEATAYVNTRWEWISSPSIDGGVGPMKVLPSQLAQASQLTGLGAAQIDGDAAANLDAGAALLASHHATGTDLDSWRDAVATTQGPYVAQQVYATLASGATRTTNAGEKISLAPQAVTATGMRPSGGALALADAPDYPSATWIPASTSNYTVANRPHDYPVDMIVIHDIEGSVSAAIQAFQDPTKAASAHYIVSYQGGVTQMVHERDIAWHAGNWDYNTRAIGIEHEGFAWTPGLYTTAEYNASAALAASICSRWGVPMDRQHVIGHNEVPDPNNPNLTGGIDHHTDPGPYWNWTYYMAQAQADAAALPSPPHLGPDPVAVGGDQSATVTWRAAHTCHLPVTGYTVTMQPGNVVQNLGPTATSATFTGLTNGTGYTFTVSTSNADGTDSLTSNSVIADPVCGNASLQASSTSPQPRGGVITLTASSTGCPQPEYEFWMQGPDGKWVMRQAFSATNTFTWDTSTYPTGGYTIHVWANQATSDESIGQSVGELKFTLTVPPRCTSAGVTRAGASKVWAGSTLSYTARSAGCPNPLYQYFVRYPNGVWYLKRAYSTDPTWTWNTAGLQPGSYLLSVWVKQSGSSAKYETYAPLTTVLSGCTFAALKPASGSFRVGTAVNFTATSAGCPNPQYEFWLEDTKGVWHRMTGFAGGAWTWSTAGSLRGTYHFSVWVIQQGAYSGRPETYSGSVLVLT